MKTKIKAILLALTIAVSSIPFSGITTNAVDLSESYTQEVDWSLWERFLKYDLCITDYDSLTEEQKELCEFIFVTERSANGTVICERARRQLAGYDVGERITLEQVENFYDIQDSKFVDSDYPYYYNEEYAKNYAILRKAPDIRHLDWDVNATEYWLDDEGKERVFTNGEDFTTYDNPYESSYLYVKYDNNGEIIEEKEILRCTDELETIEYEGCKYQVYPDDTLHFSELTDKSVSSVTIPSYINDMPVVSIKAYSFRESEITEIILPDTLEYIGTFAFMNCAKLINVNFPEALDSLGVGAFDGCISLGDVEIDCSNLLIGKLSFNGACAKNVSINTKVLPSSTMYSFESFESFIIGDDVIEVGFHFLESDLELNKNIVIPENVKVISSEGGYFPFSEVTVPSHIEVFGAYDDATGSVMTSVEHRAEIPLLENECLFYKEAIINGYYNTEAHRYAVEWGLKFNPIDPADYYYGDTNRDGLIDPTDATLALQQYSFASMNSDSLLSDGALTAADVNSDDAIDPVDATWILRYYSYASMNGEGSLEEFVANN